MGVKRVVRVRVFDRFGSCGSAGRCVVAVATSLWLTAAACRAASPSAPSADATVAVDQDASRTQTQANAGRTGRAPSGTAFSVCELYAPGHFGNSYEVAGANEMRRLLAEAAWWGFNRYGDWFDMDDCKDPFAPGHTYGLGDALWDRKKTHFASAQRLGLPCDLILTPNHVFVDQCLPGLVATKDRRVFGQLVCPSVPAARKLILLDYDHLFSDLARAGVQLRFLNAAPYDFGGCRCSKCRPWILTFARLSREIFQLARKYHPKVRMEMIGWWWSAEEHRLFAEWADNEAPGWVQRMYLHLPYGATRVANVPLPKGCQRGAFVHIGYADQASPRDVYGHLGPVVAAERLQRTVADLRSQGVTAVLAYSEGVFDDVNKALLAGLTSGRFASADQVLVAYAERYFGVSGETAQRWARWLKAWGRPFDVNTQQSGAELKRLLARTPRRTWRVRQWELKQQLFELCGQIGSGDRWTAERLQKVERFWAVQETLQREVWGLGPLRHVFSRRFTPAPWYRSWARWQASQKAASGTGRAASEPVVPRKAGERAPTRRSAHRS